MFSVQVREKKEAQEKRKQEEAGMEAREEARLQAFHAQQQARFRSVSTASPPADMGRRRTLPKACSPAQALTEPAATRGAEMVEERVPVARPADSNAEVQFAHVCATANMVSSCCTGIHGLGSHDERMGSDGRWSNCCKLCWRSSACCMRVWQHKQQPCSSCTAKTLPGDGGCAQRCWISPNMQRCVKARCFV